MPKTPVNPKKKKTVSKKNTVKKSKNVKKEIVDELKQEFKEAIKIMREDILADVHEKLQKTKIDQPTVSNPTAAAMGGINPDMIKNLMSTMGATDDQKKEFEKMFDKIPKSTLAGLGGVAAGAGGIVDMDKLSDGQLRYLTQQNQQTMLTSFLPMLLQGQGNQNPLMNEIMMRMMMDKFSTSMFMEKAMMSQMAKVMGNPKFYQDFENKQNNLVPGMMNPPNPAESKTAIPGNQNE